MFAPLVCFVLGVQGLDRALDVQTAVYEVPFATKLTISAGEMTLDGSDIVARGVSETSTKQLDELVVKGKAMRLMTPTIHVMTGRPAELMVTGGDPTDRIESSMKLTVRELNALGYEIAIDSQKAHITGGRRSTTWHVMKRQVIEPNSRIALIGEYYEQGSRKRVIVFASLVNSNIRS